MKNLKPVFCSSSNDLEFIVLRSTIKNIVTIVTECRLDDDRMQWISGELYIIIPLYVYPNKLLSYCSTGIFSKHKLFQIIARTIIYL